MPVVYIPHGGGPCFFMDWTMGPADTWDQLARFLRSFNGLVGTQPDAILVISAHHESDTAEINNAPAPPLLFDYYGFPRHTYELSYSAPGSSHLAQRIGELLSTNGMPHHYNTARGFDHGVFVPFLLMYPEANIPIVQVSLRSDLDAGFHLELGAVLAPLRKEGVLIVGSGLSYHNMRAFMTPEATRSSRVFNDWLGSATAAVAAERRTMLANWTKAPAARAAHPREEHLLPLMVVAGAAENDPGRQIFTDQVMRATISAYAFGELTAGATGNPEPNGP